MNSQQQAMHQHQPRKPDQHQHKNGRDKGGDQPQKRTNFLLSQWKIAWRYYSRLIQEGILAAILILPLWAYFQFQSVSEVTIHTDFLTLWVVAFVAFVLQSFMFTRGG